MQRLADLFEITYGHSLELNRMTLLERQKGGVAFVSRTASNNGISAHVAALEGVAPSPAGALTCALGGSVLSTFLQNEPFYSGRDIALLRPLVPMSKAQLLFYCLCIGANRYRYNYGRQANRTLRDILVPGLDELPDDVAQMDLARYDGCERPAASAPAPAIEPANWQVFTLATLFEIRKGRRLTKADRLPGQVPYVGASDRGNGVTAQIGQAPIHAGGTISVSYNGSVAEAFYQPAPYWASDDVNVLYPRDFTLPPEAALFICTLIRLEKYRFNYGRKWHLKRMRESTIRLPVTQDGTLDLEFMVRYIRALPYSSRMGGG